MRKVLRKITAVFLAVLTLISVFSINFAYAAEVIGVGNSIGNPSTSATYYQILDSGLGTDFYVVGYRFSVVDSTGKTLRNGAKNRTIDLLRYGDYGTSKFGSSSSHWNRQATTAKVYKMQRQWNKYQILESYINNTVNVSRGTAYPESAYGIKYAYANYTTTGGKNTTKPSSNYVKFDRTLPSTTGIKRWAEQAENRAVVLNAVGYSGVNENNVDTVLGTNRILIEPLYVVTWAGQKTLASAADLAILNYAYYKSNDYYFKASNDWKKVSGIYGQIYDGSVSTVRYYTNKSFQEALYADGNLDMPRYGKATPLKVQSSMKPAVPRNSSGQITTAGWTNVGKYCWSYDEILRSTLGMAIVYNKPVIKVQYNANGGTVKSSTYGTTSAGYITKNGTIFPDYWSKTDTRALYKASTFGLTKSNMVFAGWSTKKDDSGSGYANTFKDTDTTVTVQKLGVKDFTKDATITVYAQWKPAKKLIVYYNANTGVIKDANGNDYYVNTGNGNTFSLGSKGTSDLGEGEFVNYKKNYTSDSNYKVLADEWNGVDATHASGLYNASTFNLKKPGDEITQYEFVGWCLTPDCTGTVFDEDDATVKASDLCPEMVNGNKDTYEVTLYAKWKVKEQTWNVNGKFDVAYNTSQGTVGSAGYSQDKDGFVTQNSSVYKQTYTYNNTNNAGLINYSTFGLSKDGYAAKVSTTTNRSGQTVTGSLWQYTPTYYTFDGQNFTAQKHEGDTIYINEETPYKYDALLYNFNKMYSGEIKNNNYAGNYEFAEVTRSLLGVPKEIVLTIKENEPLSSYLGSGNAGSVFRRTVTFERVYVFLGNPDYGYEAGDYIWLLASEKLDYFDGNKQAKSITLSYSVPNAVISNSYLPSGGGTSAAERLSNGSGKYYENFDGFHYYIHCTNSASEWTASTPVNIDNPRYDVYAVWEPSDANVFVAYNTNGAKTDNESLSVNDDGFVVNNATGLLNKTLLGKTAQSLSSYSSLGLITPDGYTADGNWYCEYPVYTKSENNVLYQSGTHSYDTALSPADPFTYDLWNKVYSLSPSDSYEAIQVTYNGSATAANTQTTPKDGDVMTVKEVRYIGVLSNGTYNNGYMKLSSLKYSGADKRWYLETVVDYYIYSAESSSNYYYTVKSYEKGDTAGTCNYVPVYHGSSTFTQTIYFNASAENADSMLPIIPVYAKWNAIPEYTEPEYTLTVNPAGGVWEGSGETQEFILKEGDTKEISVPTREGYEFLGWKYDNCVTDLDENGTEYSVWTKDITGAVLTNKTGGTHTQGSGNCGLTAQWEPHHKITVEYDLNGGQFIEGFERPLTEIHTADEEWLVVWNSDFIEKENNMFMYWTASVTPSDGVIEDNYAAGSSLEILSFAPNASVQDYTLTLTAHWEEEPSPDEPAPSVPVVPEVYISYKTGGGEVINDDFGIRENGSETSEFYIASSDGVLYKSTFGETAETLVGYEVFGLVRNGYLTNYSWTNTSLKYTISDAGVFYPTEEIKTVFSDKDNLTAGGIFAKLVEEYKVASVKYYAPDEDGDLDTVEVNAGTVPEKGMSCEFSYYTTPSEENNWSYLTTEYMEYDGTQWIVTQRIEYRYFAKGSGLFCCVITSYGESGEKKTLAVYDDNKKSLSACYYDSDIFVETLYFNASTVSEDKLPMFSVSADWTPYKINFVTVKTKDGKTQSSESNVVEYKEGITAPELSESVGYHSLASGWQIDKNSTDAGCPGGAEIMFSYNNLSKEDDSKIYIDSVYSDYSNDSDALYINGKQLSVTVDGEGNKTIILYNVLEMNRLIIHYKSNGGTGSMEDTFAFYDDNAVALSKNTFTKSGFGFAGWAVSLGSGIKYSDGETKKAVEFSPELASGNTEITLYAIWEKGGVLSGTIKIGLSSQIIAPEQFKDLWDNPEGKIVTVTLYNGSGTKVAQKTATVPASGDSIVPVEFRELAYGTYTVKISVPCKDCYYDGYKSESFNSGLASQSVVLDRAEKEQDFILKNNIHTIRIIYENEFNENLDGGLFEISVNGKTLSVSVSADGVAEFTVPACDRSGVRYNYSGKMTDGPDEYTIDLTEYNISPPFAIDKSETVELKWKSVYIYDFKVEIEPVTSEPYRPGTDIVFRVTVTNKCSKTGSPLLEIDFNNESIYNDFVTVKEHSEVYFEFTYRNADAGKHFIAAYVNRTFSGNSSPLYEENISDNIDTKELTVDGGDLRIVPVILNGDYHPNDVVFATFYVYNDGVNDVLTADGVSVSAKFVYTAQDNTLKSIDLDTVKNVVIPNNSYISNKNTVYFKFKVPADALYNTEAAVIATIDDGNATNLNKNNDSAATVKTITYRIISDVPYIGRELSAPAGMSSSCGYPILTKYKESSTSWVVGNKAVWSEWREDTKGVLTLHNYEIGADLDVTVKVDNRCLTAGFFGNDLFVKSGYGITLSVVSGITKSAGVTEKMYGVYNSANAYYPEYLYRRDYCTSLELLDTPELLATSQFTNASVVTEKSSTHDVPILGNTVRWELPQNEASNFTDNGKGLGRKHFIPLFWKDGNYTMVCDVKELWCPAGTVAKEGIARSGKGGKTMVSGSLYDDYYTARG